MSFLELPWYKVNKFSYIGWAPKRREKGEEKGKNGNEKKKKKEEIIEILTPNNHMNKRFMLLYGCHEWYLTIAMLLMVKSKFLKKMWMCNLHFSPKRNNKIDAKVQTKKLTRINWFKYLEDVNRKKKFPKDEMVRNCKTSYLNPFHLFKFFA